MRQNKRQPKIDLSKASLRGQALAALGRGLQRDLERFQSEPLGQTTTTTTTRR